MKLWTKSYRNLLLWMIFFFSSTIGQVQVGSDLCEAVHPSLRQVGEYWLQDRSCLGRIVCIKGNWLLIQENTNQYRFCWWIYVMVPSIGEHSTILNGKRLKIQSPTLPLISGSKCLERMQMRLSSEPMYGFHHQTDISRASLQLWIKISVLLVLYPPPTTMRR